MKKEEPRSESQIWYYDGMRTWDYHDDNNFNYTSSYTNLPSPPTFPQTEIAMLTRESLSMESAEQQL